MAGFSSDDPNGDDPGNDEDGGEDQDRETWVRQAPDRVGLRRDLVLAAGLAVFSVLMVELQRSAMPNADLGWRGIEGYLWACGLGLGLAGRRRFPVSTMVLCSAIFFGVGERLPEVGASVGVQVGLFMAFYAAWAWSPDRRRVLVWTIVVVAFMFSWVAWRLIGMPPITDMTSHTLLPPPVARAVFAVLINILYFVGAAAWGTASWRSARQRHQLREQAEQLAGEQAERARRAVADERLRIARELHDVVAHHVSSIGVQAAGARRLLDRDPEASRRSLKVIEDSSREAVGEMAQIVSLLRVGDAWSGSVEGAVDKQPQPGIADIGGLVERSRAAGMPIEFRTVGKPHDVPSSVGLSLYRTVQESLANIRKHAHGARASVVVRYLDDRPDRLVEVEVIDDGTGRPSRTAGHPSTGWGHVGLRERAALHQGVTEIGPRPGGGYRVRVRLPIGSA